MYIRRSPQYRYICYSSVTNQAVWLYQGQSKSAMHRKYYRTVESERKRRRQWPKLQLARQTNIRHLLSECIAVLPILRALTKAQREAIKALQQMADDMPEFCSPFLDHDRERRHRNYLEKRRQRADYRQDKLGKRRKKPLGSNLKNVNYDK